MKQILLGGIGGGDLVVKVKLIWGFDLTFRREKFFGDLF